MTMPWYKHYNNASSSLSIQIMMDDLGVIGYAYYFLLLELLCSKFNGEDCVIDLSSTEVAVKLRIKSGRVQVILKSFSESNLLSWESLGLIIRINAPILLELKSKDFKRTRHERVSEALEPRLRYKNKNKNKNKNKIYSPNKSDELVIYFDSPIHNDPLHEPEEPLKEKFNPDLEKLYAMYPRKCGGKKKGIEKFKRIISNSDIYKSVLASIENYSQQCNGQDKKFIKMFSTFSNCWEDYLEIEHEEIIERPFIPDALTPMLQEFARLHCGDV